MAANFFYKVSEIYVYTFITDFRTIHDSVKKPNHSEPPWQTANFLYKLSAEIIVFIYYWFQQKPQNHKKPKPSECLNNQLISLKNLHQKMCGDWEI